MSRIPQSQPEFDDLIDNLLRTRPVEAAPDFAARTLARMKAQEAGLDALIDQQLAARPAQASTAFNRRTLRRIHRERWITQFSVPLAAAAAVVLSVASLWTPRPEPVPAEVQSPAVATEEYEEPSMQELVALAQDLSEAAPLLDPAATETLSNLTQWAR